MEAPTRDINRPTYFVVYVLFNGRKWINDAQLYLERALAVDRANPECRHHLRGEN